MQDLLIEVPLRRAVLARQAELALQRGSSAGRVAHGLERRVPLAVDIPHEQPVVVRARAHVRACTFVYVRRSRISMPVCPCARVRICSFLCAALCVLCVAHCVLSVLCVV